MNSKNTISEILSQHPQTWLVTGVAGFIGSNLLENLLLFNQRVIGLDNFSTGHRHNLMDVKALVGSDQWARFKMIEGDIRSLEACREAVTGCDYVLHQAALGSVPRSLQDPLNSHTANVDGFLNMLLASRDESVKRFVYAASSSTYGDHPDLPKVEEKIGRPLSPYAVTKLVNEIYADVFSRSYGFHSIGLRYFNVFGKRQDPNGAYAAVIPKWIRAVLRNEPIVINGDGTTSRDFCHIDNVVQANLLAATASIDQSEVFNVAVGDRTNLLELFELIRSSLATMDSPPENIQTIRPTHRDFRSGDVRHSQAAIEKIANHLGYAPTVDVRQGIQMTCDWFVRTNPTNNAVGRQPSKT